MYEKRCENCSMMVETPVSRHKCWVAPKINNEDKMMEHMILKPGDNFILKNNFMCSVQVTINLKKM